MLLYHLKVLLKIFLGCQLLCLNCWFAYLLWLRFGRYTFT